MADPRYLFEPLLFRAITPIHVGSGQDVGLVDLPVIRERTTGHPFLPGSGIRGALRDRCEAKDTDLTRRLFGEDRESQDLSAGCLSILDAHLLLFPVRSVPGPFVWITCPFLIDRYRRLFHELTGRESGLAAPETTPGEGEYFGGSDHKDQMYLEEYPFTRGSGTWAWNAVLVDVTSEKVLLLCDTDFLHFARHATIVRQRNRLSTAKTVLGGNLFSVEMVPAETWFFGFVGATQERVREKEGEPAEEKEPSVPMSKETASRQLHKLLTGQENGTETHVILGGDESVGLGITKMLWKEMLGKEAGR